MLSGDINLPNGGLASRFPGLYIPILDVSFNGPAPTDTQFDTVDINRQYDGFADFPLYPLNVISLLNALLGTLYVHSYDLEVSLARSDDIAAYPEQHGDTTYYFFETQDLPLFGPLRTLGVPESLIDVVEPFFRVLVDLGYDRSIPPWEPTPARLIPRFDPAKVAADLVDAIGEGINNAAALFGSPSPLSSPAPATLASPGADAAKTDTSPQMASRARAALSTGTSTGTANADVSRRVTPTDSARNRTGSVGEEGDGNREVEDSVRRQGRGRPCRQL